MLVLQCLCLLDSRAPYFEYEYEVELYEEQASGTSVVNLTAYDKDQGDNGG